MIKVLKWLFNSDKKYDHILTTREPTERYGAEIRDILSKSEDSESDAERCLELYSNIDRKKHYSNDIKPFLEKGGVVLCDRFDLSTLAYQSSQGVDEERIVEMNDFFKYPDLSLIFDLPVEEAFERMGSRRGSKEKFEKMEFQKKVREEYLSCENLYEDRNIEVIDASGSIDEVFERSKKVLNPYLPHTEDD